MWALLGGGTLVVTTDFGLDNSKPPFPRPFSIFTGVS